MRGRILRRGVLVGDVQHGVIDGDLVRFTTSGSLALSSYELTFGGATRTIHVISLARDGRGPGGEQAPGRTRVTAVIAVADQAASRAA